MDGHLLVGVVATLGTIEFVCYLTNFGIVFLVLPSWLYVKFLPTKTQLDLKTTATTSICSRFCGSKLW